MYLDNYIILLCVKFELGVIAFFTKTESYWIFLCSLWIVYLSSLLLHSKQHNWLLIIGVFKHSFWLVDILWRLPMTNLCLFIFLWLRSVSSSCICKPLSDDMFVFLTCRMQRKPRGKLKQLRSELLISHQDLYRWTAASCSSTSPGCSTTTFTENESILPYALMEVVKRRDSRCDKLW
jgi:hypothetical protein